MPIKWSALKVSEATAMIEEFINQAAEPLEQARIVAKEALNILNLPQYVDQHFQGLCGEVDRAIGGGQWEKVGRLRARIQSIRDSLPKGEVKAEQAKAAQGEQQSLM